MIVLETARAVKFADVVREATGVTPPLPDAVAGIESLPRRFEVIPADAELVKARIAEDGTRA